MERYAPVDRSFQKIWLSEFRLVMIWRCLKITTYSLIHKNRPTISYCYFSIRYWGEKKNIRQPLISNSIQPLAAKANNIERPPPAVQHLAWKPQNPGINAEASGHEQSAKITSIASARPDGINYPEEQFVLPPQKKKKWTGTARRATTHSRKCPLGLQMQQIQI